MRYPRSAARMRRKARRITKMKKRNFRRAFGVVTFLLLASGSKAQKPVGTPRKADGKPDLTGMWNGGRGAGAGNAAANSDERDINSPIASRRCAPNQRGCDDQSNQTVDQEFTGRFDASRPIYKPEFWDKVQDLDRNTNTKDPL